jgi:hypothetical protein
MARKPKPLPRTDLSHMKPVDALAAAMDTFDNAMSILFCARRADGMAGFGAVVRRDDLPSYLRFAIAIEEAGQDLPRSAGPNQARNTLYPGVGGIEFPHYINRVIPYSYLSVAKVKAV